jgi:succinate dehydrogenase flavin-adding protein (antitoxin of CptAB toxin-antitoxin module)
MSTCARVFLRRSHCLRSHTSGSLDSFGIKSRNLSGSNKVSETAVLQATEARASAISDRYIKRDHLDFEVWKKRLVYRAKQRGWLEVDLLLGTYAGENVPLMSPDELEQFEDFINLETIDIYNIITLRTDVPDTLKSQISGELSMAEKIQQWAMKMPLGTADPEKYKQIKEKNNLI